MKTQSSIHPTLSHLAVPIEPVRPYARNPRRGDRDLIAESLAANGQYRPLVANRRTGEFLRTGCRARLIELDPRFCDVIVERFERTTGRKARRVGT